MQILNRKPKLPVLLKRTTSRCPECLKPCPAEVWKEGRDPAQIFLKRTCEVHGGSSVCISSDARFYWLSKGDPENENCCDDSSCCSAEGNAKGTLGINANTEDKGTFEKLSTCVALIEIVNSCNMSCPTCFADSPHGGSDAVDAVLLGEIKERIQGIIDRKGGIEILQLSGGEPTLHPQFFELLDWAQKHSKIDYILINTNGLKIASDATFVEELAKRAAKKRLQLYLQFDGDGDAGQSVLRGGDFRNARQKCIERCGEMGLPITLAMTVIPENVSQLWSTIEFGLRFDHIRGVSFQPRFTSGRITNNSGEETPVRLNTADIILGAVEQSKGRLRTKDFTPLPCGDPNCATVGYLLKVKGKTRSISDFIDFADVQGFLHDKVRYNLEDLMKCGCDNEPLGELLRKFELDERHTFRLVIKPFMDAWSWDQDRIDRCCTHVIRPDGKLDSFCRYYSGFPDCSSTK